MSARSELKGLLTANNTTDDKELLRVIGTDRSDRRRVLQEKAKAEESPALPPAKPTKKVSTPTKSADDDNVCQFCKEGKHLVTVQVEGTGLKFHKDCIMWCPDVTLVKGEYVGLDEAYRRGRKLKCAFCKKHGATNSCLAEKCRKSYHAECAVKDNCGFTLSVTDKRVFHCAEHAEENVFTVKEIRDMKYEKGVKKFLINWLGYGDSENTWEPEEHLPPQMVEEYEALQAAKKGKKRDREDEARTPGKKGKTERMEDADSDEEQQAKEKEKEAKEKEKEAKRRKKEAERARHEEEKARKARDAEAQRKRDEAKAREKEAQRLKDVEKEKAAAKRAEDAAAREREKERLQELKRQAEAEEKEEERLGREAARSAADRKAPGAKAGNGPAQGDYDLEATLSKGGLYSVSAVGRLLGPAPKGVDLARLPTSMDATFRVDYKSLDAELETVAFAVEMFAAEGHAAEMDEFVSYWDHKRRAGVVLLDDRYTVFLVTASSKHHCLKPFKLSKGAKLAALFVGG